MSTRETFNRTDRHEAAADSIMVALCHQFSGASLPDASMRGRTRISPYMAQRLHWVRPARQAGISRRSQ